MNVGDLIRIHYGGKNSNVASIGLVLNIHDPGLADILWHDGEYDEFFVIYVDDEVEVIRARG